jgi:peptide/nickel transport system substrate-binding protein
VSETDQSIGQTVPFAAAGRVEAGLSKPAHGGYSAGVLRSWGPLAVALVAPALAACDLSSWLGGTERGAVGRSIRDPATMVVARPADASYLDPARAIDNESIEVLEQVYDRLVHWRPGTTMAEPGLATSWEPSADGKVWTFHLRAGVTFHDGTPMDADAVVFSLERQRDPAHPYHRDDFQYWNSQYRNIVAVEKVDAATVRISIDRPYAPFEAAMAIYPVSIVSPAAVARWGDDFTRHPVGTGPFVFERWDPGQRIVLRRNDRYWGDRPAFERLVFEVVEDPRQRLIALESGAVDMAMAILPEELQFVELHPGLALHETATNSITYLAMNMSRPPFDDVRVRRAVNHAINKDPIVRLAYQGLAIPADGPLPPTQWGYHEVRASYPFDPARARALLAEAAADGRFDPEVTYKLHAPATPRPYLFDPERVARVLQANLADVGVATELVLQPYLAHQRTTTAGAHDLCLFGWVGDTGDPDNFLYLLFDRDNAVPGSARNLAFYTDAEVHGLILVAQSTERRDDRERIYARVQEKIAEDAPWVPLAHSQVAIAARDDVGGIILNPTGHVVFRRARRIDR